MISLQQRHSVTVKPAKQIITNHYQSAHPVVCCWWQFWWFLSISLLDYWLFCLFRF